MSFNFKVGGTWQSLATGWVKIGGTWQEVQTAWVKVAGTWQKVFTNFSVTANKASVSGGDSGFSVTGNPGATDTVTVTPAGGAAPYTYAWTQVSASADSGPYQATSPTGAATAFTDADSSVSSLDAVTDETWRCTVTDANTNTATVDVTVRLTWTDLT